MPYLRKVIHVDATFKAVSKEPIEHISYLFLAGALAHIPGAAWEAISTYVVGMEACNRARQTEGPKYDKREMWARAKIVRAYRKVGKVMEARRIEQEVA